MLRIRALGSAIVILAGCESLGVSLTETDAQAVWHHLAAQSHVETARELVILKMTDGHVATSVQGPDLYTLSYEAKIRYLTPIGNWKPSDIQKVDSDYIFHKMKDGWLGPDGTIYAK